VIERKCRPYDNKGQFVGWSLKKRPQGRLGGFALGQHQVKTRRCLGEVLEESKNEGKGPSSTSSKGKYPHEKTGRGKGSRKKPTPLCTAGKKNRQTKSVSDKTVADGGSLQKKSLFARKSIGRKGITEGAFQDPVRGIMKMTPKKKNLRWKALKTGGARSGEMNRVEEETLREK